MIVWLSYKFVEAVFVDAEGIAAANTSREVSSQQFVSTEDAQCNASSIAKAWKDNQVERSLIQDGVFVQ